MTEHRYAISVVFFVDVEYEELPTNPLLQQEAIKKVFIEELGYAIGNFDFIHDAISERVSGTVNSIRVQKIQS